MLTRFKCAHRRVCKCIRECVGSNKMFTLLNTHTHASAHLQYKRTLNYLHPLMIVVITCGGKSHFHKVRFFPPLTVTLFPSYFCLYSPLFSPPPCCLPLLLSLFSLLSYAHLHPSSFSPSRPHPPPISSLWSAHPSLLLLLLPQGYLPSYTASPHPSLSFHLFISMSKSHPFIFLQMNRFCLWKRTGEKRSRMQRNTVSLTP